MRIVGALRVRFVNGFEPQIGDVFTIIIRNFVQDQFIGAFDHLDVPCNFNGKSVQVIMDNNQVRVLVIAAADLVDVNCDCAYSIPGEVHTLIQAMLDPAAYDAQYPGCTGAEVNGDGLGNGKGTCKRLSVHC